MFERNNFHIEVDAAGTPHRSHHSYLKQRRYTSKGGIKKHNPTRTHPIQASFIGPVALVYPNNITHHGPSNIQETTNANLKPSFHAQRKVQCRQPAVLLPQNPTRHSSRVPSRLDHSNGLLQPALGRIPGLKHSRHALGLP
jgi:hypothetical protein